MTNQYNDKDYFAMLSALNQAAAGQQDAIKRSTDLYQATTTENVDYFKQLAQISQNLLTPYTALAQQSIPLMLDSIGVNGSARQQAALPQATNIFNQQGINAQPLIASIPGWSFNTAANQSANMMNAMFGYGTSQPTEQVSNQVVSSFTPVALNRPTSSFNQSAPTASSSAFNPFETSTQAAARKAQEAQSASNASALQTQLANLKAQQAAFRPNAEFHDASNKLTSMQDSIAELQRYALDKKVNPMSPDLFSRGQAMYAKYGNQIADIPALQNKLNAELKTIEADRNAKYNGYYNSLVQDPATGKFVEKVTNPYDAQIAALQQKIELSNLPPAQKQAAMAQVQQQAAGASATNTVPVFNQPRLQNQQNNELVDFTNRFKSAQDSVNDVNGNTVGGLASVLGQANLFGNTALGNNLQVNGQNLLNRFNNTSLQSLLGQAGSAADGQLSSDITRSNQFMDAIQREVAARPDAAAEARGIINTGLDLGNQQTAGLTNRANSLMDKYMGQGDFVGNTLNSLIDPATGAVNSWLNSDVLKNVMNATINSGSNAVQNLAASRGMLDSGQTLAELQKVGTNAAGQYIVPYAGQLANNVLSQGANLAATEMQTGVNAAQNMYGLGTQERGNILNNTVSTANNRLNNYYNLLGKGADYAVNTANNRNALTGQLVNSGVSLANQAGQLGAGMLTADQGARANLMGQAIGSGTNMYNQNLNAKTGMATSGLNFANQLMNNQLGLTQGLADQYNQMGNQFANNLLTGSQNQATAQQGLQMGGLNSLLSSGQNATNNMANIYSNLGNNAAGQKTNYADMYGNAQMASAGIEANRLNQATQLQILMDQYDRAQKARSGMMGMNAGGLALSLGAMALGGGL